MIVQNVNKQINMYVHTIPKLSLPVCLLRRKTSHKLSIMAKTKKEGGWKSKILCHLKN